MLSVCTGHYAPCRYTDIYSRRCRCPKWIQGTLDNGGVIRQAANIRNWEKAELTAHDLEDAANPHKHEARTRVTIADAIQCFRDDEKSRHLSEDSNRKSAFFEIYKSGMLFCGCIDQHKPDKTIRTVPITYVAHTQPKLEKRLKRHGSFHMHLLPPTLRG
jgi:hypothetical protein